VANNKGYLVLLMVFARNAQDREREEIRRMMVGKVRHMMVIFVKRALFQYPLELLACCSCVLALSVS